MSEDTTSTVIPAEGLDTTTEPQVLTNLFAPVSGVPQISGPTTQIDPNALLASLNPDLFGESQTKVHALPGGTTVDGNRLSDRQVATIIRFAQTSPHFSSGMTWAQVCTKMRQLAGIRGAQYDFGIVNWIMEELRKPNQDQPLTEGQMRFCKSLIQALNGSHPHFDPTIRGRIAGDRASAQILAQLFLKAETQKQFQNAVGKFEAAFGTLQRQQPNLGSEASEVVLDPMSGFSHDPF